MAVSIVRFLAAQPPPICWIATPTWGLRWATGALATSKITVDDITRSIGAAQAVLGELDDVQRHDQPGLKRVAAHVGKYVKQAGNPAYSLGATVPKVPEALVTRFLAYWCEAFKKRWRDREYTLDDDDNITAAHVLNLALRGAREEAKASGEVPGENALETRAVQIAAYWVTRYFDDTREWIVREDHKLGLLLRCVGPYGRGGKKKRAAEAAPAPLPPPPMPLRKAPVSTGLPGTEGHVFEIPAIALAGGTAPPRRPT